MSHAIVPDAFCPCGGHSTLQDCCLRKRNIGPAQYPLGTLAPFGPDDEKITEMIVAVIPAEGAKPKTKKFGSKNLRKDRKQSSQILAFFRKHQAQTFLMPTQNLGRPHDATKDYRLSRDCSSCHWWKERMRGANIESDLLPRNILPRA